MDPLQELRVAITNASITERKVLEAAVRVGDSKRDRIAKLEAALKPFADWYTIQRGRQGATLDIDNPQLCFCNRRGEDGIKAEHLRAAADLLANPDG
jgi:hypothetical protein